MTIWKTDPVDLEPEIILVRWRIMKTAREELHFVGARTDDLTGRVSSAIVELDLSRRVGVTRSGRVYALQGNPGFNVDADYVWSWWCGANQVTAWEDVTNAVLTQSNYGGIEPRGA
jgi:hypothetical protein